MEILFDLSNLDLSVFKHYQPDMVHTVRLVVGYKDENDDKKFVQNFLTGVPQVLCDMVKNVLAGYRFEIMSVGLVYVGSFDYKVPDVSKIYSKYNEEVKEIETL